MTRVPTAGQFRGGRDPKARASGTSRSVARMLAWAADVRWRDGLAIAFTAGAVVCSAALVADALNEDSNTLVILAAVAGLLAVAGQFAIRREMVLRQAESRKYWFSSSPRGLAEVDAELQFMEGNSRLASLHGEIEEAELRAGAPSPRSSTTMT